MFHRLEHRIRAHVLICWLALLLVRVAERHTGPTWRRIATELDAAARRHPHRARRHRRPDHPPTDAQTGILGACGVPRHPGSPPSTPPDQDKHPEPALPAAWTHAAQAHKPQTPRSTPTSGPSCHHQLRNPGIKAFSETDFRQDLQAFDVPTLVVHGDDDQVVPFTVGGQSSAAIVQDATLVVYEGAPHGITDTHKERLGEDLLEFVKA